MAIRVPSTLHIPTKNILSTVGRLLSSRPVKVEAKMNAEKCHQVLGRRFIFLQDNDPKQTTVHAQKVLERPSQSPDVDPGAVHA